MTAQPWTLSGELCKQAGVSGERQALYDLGLISDLDCAYTIRTDHEWIRGGAETYILPFWIDVDGASSSHYIMKACVSLNLSRGVSGTLDEWVRRRNLLASHGVSVPRLFAAGHGVIVEEFIPWQLKERVLTRCERRMQILTLLTDYAACLAKLGFAPVDWTADLRTRGGDLVVVDFGQDLGPPGMVAGDRLDLWRDVIQTAWEWKLIAEREPGQSSIPMYLFERFRRLRQ